ncbi:MAG: methyltransferase domain-containing protein [archaeon]|nr:methyltransferase domain-containing protein [archaeon]
MRKKFLNLGSGKDYRDSNEEIEWINLDNCKKVKADVYADLEKKLPFKIDTFDGVYTCHVLEHIKNLDLLMSELKRVCKNGAVINIRVPHASCLVTYQDPTHVRFFTYMTFDYFTDWNFYDNPKFKILKKSLNYTAERWTFLNYIFNPIINICPTYYERLFGWIFPCAEVKCKLEVVKSKNP